MKALIVVAALFAGPLFAQHLLSDPLPPEFTHCGVRVNSDPVIDVPVTPYGDGESVCYVDLLNFPIAGAYDVTLTGVIAGSSRFETAESPVVRLREVQQSGRVRWQAWTNLFCPNTGAVCYWQ